MTNDYYEAMISGRFPLTISTVQTGPEQFTATYESPSGDSISAEGTSQLDAHNQCSELVRKAVHDRILVPSF